MTSAREALRSIFPAFVETAHAAPMLADDDLYPEERQYIAGAVAKRRAEFATARICARSLLSRLGVAPGPLAVNSDRSPRWPAGIVGSISHTDGHCAVVLARDSQVGALGLDIEVDKPLDPDLLPAIVTLGEARWLGHQPAEERGRLATLIFVAKEAFYKCQFPLTNAFLGFHDVELVIDRDRLTFEISHVRSADVDWSAIRGVEGRFQCAEGLLFAGALLDMAASTALRSYRPAETRPRSERGS